MVTDNDEQQQGSESHEPPEFGGEDDIARQDIQLESYFHDESIPSEPLTERERQILTFIVKGKTNKEIARHIYRTTRTVEFHRNSLMRKFEAHTVADLVRKALAAGYN